MGFERYTKAGSRIGKPQISIWSRGQIGFNQASILKYNIVNYKYAVAHFDKEGNRIGITLTNDATEEGTNKLVYRKSGGVSFSAMSFLKTYKVDYSKTKKYDIEYNTDTNMFIINVNNPSES